jgi:diguanylate cyclase (GGDEF)-like protein
MSDSPITEAARGRIQEIYERWRTTFEEQVTEVEAAAVAALCGTLDESTRELAQRQAHKIAGSAGTFGFPRASELGRELELLFQDFASSGDPDTPRRMATIAVALRESLDADPVRRESPSEQQTTRDVLLLLDDDEKFASHVALEAAKVGIHTVAVSSVDDARSALTEGVDAALLSIGTRRQQAAIFELLSELSSHTPSIPAMILTRGGDFSERVEVARRGGRGFLDKPLPASQVVEATAQLLNRVRVESMTVLAVDDDPVVLDVVKTLLHERSIDVHTLSEPRWFWDTLEEVNPDLLLLDVDMPEASGIELCRVVRNDVRWSQMPVLFLTADNSAATMNDVYQSGGDDYIMKPIDGTELVLRLTNRLERLRHHRRLADTDELTGAANRRKAINVVDRLLQLSERFGQPVTLGLIGIDHFKSLNETQGHAQGDQLLRNLSTLLLQAFRGEDVVARWGGSHFLVGMYGMRAADAEQRFAEVLEQFHQQSANAAVGVTFSAGIAEHGPDGDTLQSLDRSANTALFFAKNSGGNRIVTAEVARMSAEIPSLLDIALVDDDDALATLLMHAFEMRGLRAQRIATGDGAIDQLCGANPAIRSRVIVLDWDLPGVVGPGVLQQMAQDGILQFSRVIMLTSRSTESETLSTLQIGAADHVAKPFSIPVLMQRIRNQLDAFATQNAADFVDTR